MKRFLTAIVILSVLSGTAYAQQGGAAADEDTRNALGLGENEKLHRADDSFDDEEAADAVANDDENSIEDTPPPPPPLAGHAPGLKPSLPASAREPVVHKPQEHIPPPPIKPETTNAETKAETAPAEDADLALALFATVEATPDLPAQFMSLWEQRRQALKKHDNLKAAARLSMLNQLFTKYGGGGALQQSLRSVALALAREAQTALEQNDVLRAIALSESAAKFAPEIPAVQFTAARVRFARAPGDPASYIKAWRQGLRAYFADMGSLFGVLLSLALLIAGTLLLSNLVFDLTLVLKTIKLAVHDLGHFLPRGVSSFQAWLLLILLAVLPVLLRLGPVYIALWWLLMAWPYLLRRERLVAALMQLAALSLFVWVYLAAILLSPASQQTIQIYDITHDLSAKSGLAQLDKMLADQPKDPLILAAMGLLAKRDGKLKKASQYDQAALRQEPDWAWLHNNLANVLLLQGKTDAALNEYRRAGEIEPSLFAAAFNTSTVYFRMHKMSQGQAATQTAKNIDPQAYARFKAITDAASKRAYNQILVDVPIRQSLLLSQMLSSLPDTSALRDDLAAMFYAGLPLNKGTGIHAGLIVLLLLMALISAKLHFSHACPRCGQAACGKCSAELPRQDVCAQCFHAFLAPSKDIDAALKVRKEIEVRRYLARRGRMVKVLSLLAAGLGHAYAGAPVRGALGLLVVSALVTSILFIGGLVPMPYVVKASWPLLSLVILGVLFVIVALLGLLGASKLED